MNDPLADKIDEMLLWLYVTGSYHYYYEWRQFIKREEQREELKLRQVDIVQPLSLSVFLPLAFLFGGGFIVSFSAFATENLWITFRMQSI